MFNSTHIPLSERLRPSSLDTFAGQKHLVGSNGILRKMIEAGSIPSMILWGPPGVGKTTLANIIASTLKRPFYVLSAISAGVKEVREIIEKARALSGGAVLFIDEIHRFSKSQQDALLGAVERGVVTLIGATTENPSFEVNAALLSRCQVYQLKSLSEEDMQWMVDWAIANDRELKKKNIEIRETGALFSLSGGDVRRLLNLLELSINLAPQEEEKSVVTDEVVMQAAQQRTVRYDKSGEQHYDIISAFIKSIRGSDPNATLYWMARMIEGGEDPVFIARRLLIAASEDIGNANPNALLIATSCFQAVTYVGYPEAEIILSQTAVYLASSVKSNASYMAIWEARELVRKTGDLPVPMHLRNAPTAFMKKQGYGQGYKYAHDFKGNFASQEYLPEEIKGTAIYKPGENARENELRQRLKHLWGDKYGY